jgi:hypothetical protein
MNARRSRARRRRLSAPADPGGRSPNTPVGPTCQNYPRGRRPEHIAAESFSEIEGTLGHLGRSVGLDRAQRFIQQRFARGGRASASTNSEGG